MPAYDFRRAEYGMTREQVKATESIDITSESDTLAIYTARVADKQTLVVYIFADDRFVRAKYLFQEQHSNLNNYIQDFEDVKQILIEKYGSPSQDTQVWNNDLWREKYSDWGMGISVGHLSYWATWETPTSVITLYLHGENYQITLEAEYSSKKLKYLEEEVRRMKTLEDF